MKFFKHFTDAHRGTSLMQVRDSLGVAGIGMYWILVEICCEKLAKNPDVEYTVEHCRFQFNRNYLANILGTKPKRLQNVLGTFQEHSLIALECSDNVIKIEMPKLLECMDRDSKRARTERVPPAPKRKSKRERKSSCPDFLNLESLLAAIPKETQDGWAKLYTKEFIDRELIRAWNYYVVEKPKTLNGWSRALSGWLERQTKWNANDAGAKRPATGGWGDTDGVS